MPLYGFLTQTWKRYPGDYHYVWSVALSPDRSAVAIKVDRDRRLPSPLLLLDLATGNTRVLMDSFNGSAPVSWAPDGTRFAYERAVPSRSPDAGGPDSEIRIRDVRSQHDTRLAEGTSPSWSPSGEWIAYPCRRVFDRQAGWFRRSRTHQAVAALSPGSTAR